MENNITASNESRRKRMRRSDTDSQCAACTRLFSHTSLQQLNSETGLTYQTRNACESSARTGCGLCSLICQLTVNEFGSKWRNHDPLVFRNFNSLKGSEDLLYTLRGTLKARDGYITLYPFAEQDKPLSSLISRRPIVRDVQSQPVISAAETLLRDCQRPDRPNEGHEECRYSRDTVLPSRVLHVGDKYETSPSIRLHINDKERCGSYLALSYCWGPKPVSRITNSLVQLEHANQRKLQEGIRMEDLEQTIQDAIYITRQLGFNYLWVDRFCILQDDDDDKKQEFSRMATTYKNAVITLVAGTAKAASEGFLYMKSTRKPYLPSQKFSIRLDDGPEGVVYLADRPYQPSHPIDSRGWTLQEFMLSSRMLIFSDYQLLWQCKQRDLQSVTGDDDGLEYQQGIESLPWAAFEDTAGISFGAYDGDKLYLWKTIIRQYTERNLTNPDDRLPAITGIIAELQNVWKDIAIYGHWVEWFIHLLAWHKPQGDRAKSRNLTRAPSWSWVSIEGRIHFDELIEREDARMEIVTAGKMTMSCRIVPEDVIDDDTWEEIDQYFDLAEAAHRSETRGKICYYILLGTAKECDEVKNAIALMAVEIRHGVYRRIGLAVVVDESIWSETKHRSIELEPKHK